MTPWFLLPFGQRRPLRGLPAPAAGVCSPHGRSKDWFLRAHEPLNGVADVPDIDVHAAVRARWGARMR